MLEYICGMASQAVDREVERPPFDIGKISHNGGK